VTLRAARDRDTTPLVTSAQCCRSDPTGTSLGLNEAPEPGRRRCAGRSYCHPMG